VEEEEDDEEESQEDVGQWRVEEAGQEAVR
jgi:hypothetical protein